MITLNSQQPVDCSDRGVSRRIDMLDDNQRRMVSTVLRGQKFVDLGGHDGDIAEWLLDHGASEALVVDKQVPDRRYRHPNLRYLERYFVRFLSTPEGQEAFDAAVLSFPINNWEASNSLIPVLKRMPRIVYIGQNNGCTQCGTPLLWHYLTGRGLSAQADGPVSVLVYNNQPRNLTAQPLTREEMSGLHAEELQDRAWTRY